MREKVIEQHLKKKIQARGGLCYKFTSPGSQGVPDRLVLMPGNRTYFIEVKAPGKRLTPLQAAVRRRIEYRGHWVFVVDSRVLVNFLVALL